MKVSKIGLENLKLIAIHAISRTGDVPLTSGNWEDVRHESAAAVRTTSEAAVSDGLGSRVCVRARAVRVVLILMKQSQFRACVLHSAISGASSY